MANKEKKLKFHEALEFYLDGRTSRWLMEKSKIHESDISRLRTGRLTPTEQQVQKIIAVFPDFTYEK